VEESVFDFAVPGVGSAPPDALPDEEQVRSASPVEALAQVGSHYEEWRPAGSAAGRSLAGFAADEPVAPVELAAFPDVCFLDAHSGSAAAAPAPALAG